MPRTGPDDGPQRRAGRGRGGRSPAIGRGGPAIHCVCAFVLPCYLPELKRPVGRRAPRWASAGSSGFPPAPHSTAIKAAEAREQVAQGATELDMVINVGMLRSGRSRYVEDDIRAVVEAAGGRRSR